LLRRQIGSRWPTVEYLTTRDEVIFTVLKGSAAVTLKLSPIDLRRYENPDVALNTGMILKDMLRHEPLAKTLLYSDRFALSRSRWTASNPLQILRLYRVY
jgi:calcium binding protein 39